MERFFDTFVPTFILVVIVLFLILTLPLHIWWTWKGWDIKGMIWYMTLTESQHVSWKRLKKWRYIREQKVE